MTRRFPVSRREVAGLDHAETEIHPARTRPEVLAHGHHSVERQFTATVTFRSGTIDQLVYDLYGLTEVEITIVEGSLRGCMVCGFN